MRYVALISTVLLAAIAASASAQEQVSAASSAAEPCAITVDSGPDASSREAAGVGVGIVLDEHLLTDATRDHDYNGGGEVTLSGERAGFLGRALDRALRFVDAKSCPRNRFVGHEWQATHAFAAGLLIFTPKDLSDHGVVRGDRPYASLFFISAGRRYTSSDANLAYSSSLTLGVLGLHAAYTVQNSLHRLTNSEQPQGWSHQISAGGEPTIRYSAARQSLLAHSGQGDIKWTLAGSVGTITEASVALNTRWGRVESPWWAFTPEQNMYVQETQPLPPLLESRAPYEVFAFAGARLKVRAYNALLQGQFRHSDLRYGADDLNQVLGEVWGGVALRTSAGWSVQYLARWQSAEMRSGLGSRSILWGSVEIAKAFH